MCTPDMYVYYALKICIICTMYIFRCWIFQLLKQVHTYWFSSGNLYFGAFCCGIKVVPWYAIETSCYMHTTAIDIALHTLISLHVNFITDLLIFILIFFQWF